MGQKSIRIFLDSNVILSGLLSEKGPPRIILDLFSLRLPFLLGMTGKYNLLEIERNLAKKLPALLPLYKDFFPKLNIKIIPLPSTEQIGQYAQAMAKKDVPVLVSAINGKADFLVTGDKKDFDKIKGSGKYPLTVVNPREFLDIILTKIEKENRD
jgi:putative PIN family toxin of toxin-antitoxin system